MLVLGVHNCWTEKGVFVAARTIQNLLPFVGPLKYNQQPTNLNRTQHSQASATLLVETLKEEQTAIRFTWNTLIALHRELPKGAYHLRAEDGAIVVTTLFVGKHGSL